MAQNWRPPPAGSICWVEIPTTGTVEDLKEFYSKLFPSWTWRASHGGTGNEDPHQVAHFNMPEGSSGGIVKMAVDYPDQTQSMGSGMTVYYIVPNLEEVEAKVHELGGKTCVKKTAEGRNSSYMNFYDPQGNRFGAYHFGGQ